MPGHGSPSVTESTWKKVLLDAVPVYWEPMWMRCGNNSSRAPKNQENTLPKVGRKKCIGCTIYRSRIATENIWKAANITRSELMPHCNTIATYCHWYLQAYLNMVWRYKSCPRWKFHEMLKYQPLSTPAQAEKAVNLITKFGNIYNFASK